VLREVTTKPPKPEPVPPHTISGRSWQP
jgi:hypothetical protein